MKADFSRIYKEAFRITKTNKRLWVVALVLVAFTGGFSGTSFKNTSDNFSKKLKEQQNTTTPNYRPTNNKKINYLNTRELTSALPQVLGTATSSMSTLASVFRSIPVTFFIALALLILVTLVLGFSIIWYGKSWAESALIHGISQESHNISLSLNEMGEHGKGRAWEVIKIRTIPAVILPLAILIITPPVFLPLLLNNSTGVIITILLFIVWFLVVTFATITMSSSANLGVLAINLESLKWKDAFKRGFAIFKRYLLDISILGILNCCLGCITCFGLLIVTGLLVGIGAATVVGAMVFPPLLVAAGPVIFLALIAIIMLSGLVNAIVLVFKQSTWVLLYKQLTEVQNGQQ